MKTLTTVIPGRSEGPDPESRFASPRNDSAKLPRIRPRLRRQRRRWRAQRGRIAPGAGVAAGDQPVDDAGDDARAGHDLEVTPHDALELQRVGMKGNEAEIAGQPHDAAAH